MVEITILCLHFFNMFTISNIFSPVILRDKNKRNNFKINTNFKGLGIHFSNFVSKQNSQWASKSNYSINWWPFIDCITISTVIILRKTSKSDLNVSTSKKCQLTCPCNDVPQYYQVHWLSHLDSQWRHLDRFCFQFQDRLKNKRHKGNFKNCSVCYLIYTSGYWKVLRSTHFTKSDIWSLKYWL